MFGSGAKWPGEPMIPELLLPLEIRKTFKISPVAFAPSKVGRLRPWGLPDH